ncbi:type II toxin-antitoxin system death-on-curing family toxin [Leptolyngbya sp. NK1-12]|uniref:Type II toxin-antitoxin system death-on-curing family toxin n=1 Tax=Leptolyngbya sp. NK1-12 TaxID=2547451 RepID=A0AA96WID3_9CYAN|nr:type II toxin-antitoxin system death-on-curing family toxin [Leptolyngbya sp. NK1-12]WNZ22746.1 type II toxin-antitoxin system death-on-curing family toxin [Leptolyngbya sp. NK1-12]
MQTPEFLSRDSVLKIHARQIQQFGGTAGVRDEGLLESALAQPQASFGGQLLHPTIAEQAAAYLFHLAMNHPFVDGNKRTAFAVMDTFLRLNGYSLNLSDQQAYELVIQVVEGRLDKTALSQRLQSGLVRVTDDEP